jgi:Protein of unknown function (DUF2726)
LNRRAGAEPFVSEPLPDAPWPVAARNLLTDRENSLYQRLLSFYPDHKIFVQVALSQLIEVDRNHPESESIRAQYKLLVADFVLCRSDLSVVAVIELDDRSHEHPKRQRADARKNKALADAGIRLVRVPAGTLPSEDALRDLVNEHGTGNVARDESVLRLAETVDTFPVDVPPMEKRDDVRSELRALQSMALKAILGGVVIVGGWFLYSQFPPFAVQRALPPLAVRHVIAPAAQPSLAAAVIPTKASPLPVDGGPSAQTLAEEKSAGLQAAMALQKQKSHAWAAFYSAPTSCEHPVDWNAQVECGNQFMRAKKRFEAQWAAEHAADQTTGAAVVLDNGSMGRAHN